MVKSLFNWLVEEKVLTVNPMADQSLGVDAAEDRVRPIVVPDFRFINLLCAGPGEGQDRLIFELLLGTGGRRSEVAGIKVGDVDFDAKCVWIREGEGKLVRKARPKNGHVRSVPAGPELVRRLWEQLLCRGVPDSGEPLIVSSEGGCLRWNNYLQRTFRPAVESTPTRWAVGERKRLLAEGLDRRAATARALDKARGLAKLTPITFATPPLPSYGRPGPLIWRSS